MHLHPIEEINIPPRQRSERPPGHIRDLKKSILSKGLLQPIVITESGDLVCGESRLIAIEELYKEGGKYKHNGEDVEGFHIPASYIHELSPADLAEAELEENLIRASLTWLEEQDAIALIHKLRVSQNPAHTQADTARELIEKTGNTLQVQQNKLTQAIVISENRDNPRVRAAKSPREAYMAVLDQQASAFKAKLMTTGVIKTNHQLIHGDCSLEMPKLEAGSVDLILSDPPYGIDVHKMKKQEKHFYDDSPELAIDIYTHIFREGFRLLKSRGLVFLFCDIEHFTRLRELSKQFAFTPWRTPVIWHKGQDGFAPWGREGFIRTYESILILSKGEKGLCAPGGSDVIKDITRTKRSERVHAAEKPVELFNYLLDRGAVAGDTILDPCMGSGPILEAASRMRMRCIGIEKDESYYAEACARLSKPAEEEPLVTENMELLA